MKVAFSLLGISTVSLLVASVSVSKKIGWKIGNILLLVSAIGYFLASFFNTDPATVPSEQMTTTGTIHSMGAGFSGMIVLAVLFFLWQFIKDPQFKEYKNTMIFVTALLWVSEIILIAAMASYLPDNNGNLGPNVPIGWQGRFMIICGALWLIVFAKQLDAVKRQALVTVS